MPAERINSLSAVRSPVSDRHGPYIYTYIAYRLTARSGRKRSKRMPNEDCREIDGASYRVGRALTGRHGGASNPFVVLPVVVVPPSKYRFSAISNLLPPTTTPFRSTCHRRWLTCERPLSRFTAEATITQFTRCRDKRSWAGESTAVEKCLGKTGRQNIFRLHERTRDKNYKQSVVQLSTTLDGFPRAFILFYHK